MNRRMAANLLISVSGGITGIIAYGIICSVSGTGGNYILLIVSMVVFSLLFSFLWIQSSLIFFRLFGEDFDVSLKAMGRIFLVPLLLIPAAPLYYIFYDTLKISGFDILGNVYVPMKGYIHLNLDGYSLVCAMGFIITTIMFLSAIRVFAAFFRQHMKFDEKRKSRILFILLFVFFAAVTAYTTFAYPPTGDEPHYLIISRSITEDGDINLENDYTEKEAYSRIFPRELDYKSIHNTADKNGNGVYSLHSIGLPLFIAPLYRLGGRFGVQLLMNFFTALLGVLLYRFLRKNLIPEKTSLLTAFLLMITVPLSVDSSLVLTEIPSALIILYCISQLYNYEDRKNRMLFFAGIAALPWIHAKLAVFSAALYAGYYIFIIVTKRFRLRNEIINNIPVLIIGGALTGFYYAVYGKFVPAAMTSVYVSDSFYFIFSILHFIKAFFAVFFDRDYGVFVYNPLYIIFIWGAALMLLKKSYTKLVPLAVTLPYFILYMFWNDWGGSMTPARQMIPVMPVWAFYFAYFLRETSFDKTKVFKAMAVFAVFVSYILMVFPALRYASPREKIYPVLEKMKILWLAPSFSGDITFSHLIIIPYIIIIILLFLRYRKGDNPPGSGIRAPE